MHVLDTNVIIRHLTQDNDLLSKKASAILEQVELGTAAVYIGEGVLVEAVEVLSSEALYNIARRQICDALDRLIDLPGVTVPFRGPYHRALELYLRHRALSFVDCLCVAHAERLGADGLLSFDQGYDRVSVRADTAIRRVEQN
jgi:predicted nucleic-acid-binding protein